MPGFLYLRTFNLLKPLQFFWCWFSSFALSDLMKNRWFSISFVFLPLTMPLINLQISIFITYHVWLDKELLVLPIFMYFYLRQLLQFSWRFWFSSLALSDLMKSQCFSWSWSDFTLDSLFNFLEDFNCHHLPCLTWWGIDGSTNLLMFLPLIAPSILLKRLILSHAITVLMNNCWFSLTKQLTSYNLCNFSLIFFDPPMVSH